MVALGNTVVDASVIDVSVLNKLYEVGDVEANVAIGYHAIEFLLWGRISTRPRPAAATDRGPTMPRAANELTATVAGALIILRRHPKCR